MLKKYLGLSILSAVAMANSSSMSFYGGMTSEKQKFASIAGIDNKENQQKTTQNTQNVSDVLTNGVKNINTETNTSYKGYDLSEFENRGETNKKTSNSSKKSNGHILSKEKEYKLVNYIHTQNPKLTKEEIYGILKKVWRHSKNYKMNPYLVLAVMNTESHFKHSTVSRAGAMGLMQLMDFNIKEFGVDNSVEGNIKGGVMHLARDYYSHDRSVIKTLVCYNAGCGRLPNDAWKNIKETREYIPKVKKYFDILVSL